MSIRGWLAVLRRRIDLDVSDDTVRHILEKHDLERWFFEGVFKQRKRYYWNAWKSSLWLARRLRAGSRILETGCGPGFNLVWFGQHGFRELYGVDIDRNAVAAAEELCRAVGTPATFWLDDSVNPSLTYPGPFDAILALNWTYLVAGFELEPFLRRYRPLLTTGGYLVLDVIDASYNTIPNNQYHTADWDKTECERRPSEYKTRYWGEDVQGAAARAGLRCVKVVTGPTTSKIVYVLAPAAAEDATTRKSSASD